MNVTLLDYSGIDLSALARIARVSRGGTPFLKEETTAAADTKAKIDFRTVSNCYRKGHFSLFEFPRFTFYIVAPVYVMRQIMRYRCGSYLERSLRYCEPPEKLLPIDARYALEYQTALDNYKNQIKNGVPKEVARKLLPVCTPTAVVCQYSLRELFHIFDERLTTEAQTETREAVNLIYNAIEQAAPWAVAVYESKKENPVT